MALIDEQGRLFGRVNAFDAFMVILVVSMIAAGLWLFMGPGHGEQALIDYRASVPAPVADAATGSDAELEHDELVAGPMVTHSWTNATDRQERRRIELTARAELVVTEGAYRHVETGDRLYIGKKVDVDLGVTRFSATVTDIRLQEKR